MNKNSPLFLLVLVIVLSVALWNFIPLEDAKSFFNFADKRTLISIPNALDVLSNLPFFFVGIYGFKNLYQSKHELFWFGFFISLSSLLTAFSSTYFHWAPTPDTLVPDRLTMTFGFSAIISIIIADRISLKLGHVILTLLIPLGLYSVLGYHWGHLSLRPYILLQYGGIVYCLIASFLLKANRLPNKVFLGTIGLYVLAKIFEIFDHQVFQVLELISGHSIKHIIAALAVFNILTIFKKDDLK
jgi:hypothetical protein